MCQTRDAQQHKSQEYIVLPHKPYVQNLYVYYMRTDTGNTHYNHIYMRMCTYYPLVQLLHYHSELCLLKCYTWSHCPHLPLLQANHPDCDRKWHYNAHYTTMTYNIKFILKYKFRKHSNHR